MTLYVRTLATTLLLGDSREYQVLYFTLGLAQEKQEKVLGKCGGDNRRAARSPNVPLALLG